MSGQPEAIAEASGGVPAVGTAIREARLKAEMTQDELGEALGVTQACVSYWETARRDLGVTDLLRVAAALNVPVVSLLGAEYFAAADPLPPPVADYGPVRLELMGHRYREGRLSEVVIAGQPFLKLGLAGGLVEYYRPDAVYCITPGMVTPLAAIPERFSDALDDSYDDDNGGPF